ncbi:probable C-mannosyltransferase DPY19L3 isoform X2 [Canis lupus dingo]|nr:probable C-mannosyltransferase DPY19L3 isoform X2 [Canis lupus dingo]
MLQAPTLMQGFHGLIYDNKTESMRTINLLQRMNIYQEVFLSILYRVLPIQKYLEPVYFYIYTLFGLQAIYVTALYVTSWLLSGTWLSGLLAAFWYVTNRIDTTRVEFTIPLRENWALPFFAIQIAAITYFLRPNLQPLSERLTLLAIFISTFLFSLTWQFNQFMMLMQALVLFTLDSLDMLPAVKATWLYGIQMTGLLLVCILQFFNSMILGSLLISFNLSVLIARKLQKNLKTGSFLNRLGKLLLHLFAVLCLTLFLNSIIKKILNLKSDEHIFKFLKAKFGFGATRDFDANLYLCEEAFGLLPFNTFGRLSDTLLFYAYIFVLCITVIAALAVAFHNLSDSKSQQSTGQTGKCTIILKPETAYNLIHTILFGFLALSTMRMKYLWTSHMCVFASFGLCSPEIWELLLKSIHLYKPKRICIMRYSVPILILLYLCYKFWPGMMDELSELREFYDPDTVELMNWINSNTPRKAVFAGSMQLLAGVKLCTGRTLTNHPHYEDNSLRERTKAPLQAPGDLLLLRRVTRAPACGVDKGAFENKPVGEGRQRTRGASWPLVYAQVSRGGSEGAWLNPRVQAGGDPGAGPVGLGLGSPRLGTHKTHALKVLVPSSPRAASGVRMAHGLQPQGRGPPLPPPHTCRLTHPWTSACRKAAGVPPCHSPSPLHTCTRGTSSRCRVPEGGLLTSWVLARHATLVASGRSRERGGLPRPRSGHLAPRPTALFLRDRQATGWAPRGEGTARSPGMPKAPRPPTVSVKVQRCPTCATCAWPLVPQDPGDA